MGQTMAVREMKQDGNLKMSVCMKSGQEYLGCDIPPKPNGDAEVVVAFWWENAIRMVPLQDVLYVDFYEDSE